MTSTTDTPPAYRLGDRLLFQEEGNSEKHLLTGWSIREPTHRWTEGHLATLHLTFSETAKRDLVLRIECFGFLAGDSLAYQSVDVWVNDHKIACWRVHRTQWYEAAVPRNLVPAGYLKVGFEISNPSSPCDSQLSMDRRQLGLCLLGLEILVADDPGVVYRTAQAREKPFFSVYGNCQAESIARCLESCPEFAERFDYLELPPVYYMTSKRLQEFACQASKMGLLIFMNSHAGEFPSSDIVALIPDTCERICIPSLFFNGYNPEIAYLRQPGSVLFYHDRIMLQYIHDFDGFKGRLLVDEDFFPESFSKDCVDASLTELAGRERKHNMDVRITDFIAEHYQRHRLFHVMNHPSVALIREVTARILGLLGITLNPGSVVPVGALDSWQFPIYRSHFLNLGIMFDNTPEYWRLGSRLSVEEFFQVRKADYEVLDLDFAKRDLFSFTRPVFRGEDMASGFQF